ncbi:MAG: tRNA (adenosine(37)-N6)-dimethylallyltransferase MiaA [Patescibacteria group bacterium]|nr:tRNA (adenosine(37)-N6)-dimethylallyltransferase MiaA [Patescibacteria group bacterium]
MKKMDNKPKIIVICGQTGSGKTNLAVQLCKKFKGEIVNADSRQVYKEMNIGTAKGGIQKSKIKNQKFGVPSAQYILDGVPIWLVNIVEPNERYNVGQFKKDAEETIADIISRGKVPFIVGGTGLYIDALVDNYEIPEERTWSDSRKAVNEKTRLRVSLRNSNSKSLAELVDFLGKVDSDAQKIVDLKNRRRVERALEYCLTTGKKFSESRKKGEQKYEVLKIAPLISREKLLEKIGIRVEEMIEQGLEKEVKKLAGKYGWESEAMTGIGYREWGDYFASVGNRHACSKSGKNSHGCSLQSVKDRIKIDTRQYAKRQMTWFKRDKEINWVHPVKSPTSRSAKQFDGVKNEKQAKKLVKKFLG